MFVRMTSVASLEIAASSVCVCVRAVVIVIALEVAGVGGGVQPVWSGQTVVGRKGEDAAAVTHIH